ncbi:MAG: 3-methyl-2-oxobutanoate hydroxymethyltransferase [Clostridiales Family XIII bacterium]|jgi:3-methyl-2-oxobutanoate hydroxymethyltransferase|nr:3-methyl-2-oxobutanoate hydroxymethyltransferase [Clostridiales Family XIII bacterium]
MKHTVVTLRQQKQNKEKITMLTVYDYSTAKLMDEAGIEVLLVGDSLGNTVLGYPDTLSVTMDDMLHHCAAVARGAKDALVLGDMPFMSYQASVYDAVTNAGRFMKEGRAQAVKLEGGAQYAEHIRAITAAGIPVCGHLGLTPQSVNAFGGFKVQGKDTGGACRLIEDALAIEEAGVFAIVLECVPAELAAYLTGLLQVPTIGIGAGSGTDGQVLVYQDMLSMYGGRSPKFAKVFADVGSLMKEGFASYCKETKAGAFPGPEHGFAMDPGLMETIRGRYS